MHSILKEMSFEIISEMIKWIIRPARAHDKYHLFDKYRCVFCDFWKLKWHVVGYDAVSVYKIMSIISRWFFTISDCGAPT